MKNSSQSADPPTLSQKELYEQLKAKVIADGARGAKAAAVKQAVLDLAKEVGDSKLIFKAMYPVIKAKIATFKVARAQLMNVCEHNWTVEDDEAGLQWVHLDRPKPVKVK